MNRNLLIIGLVAVLLILVGAVVLTLRSDSSTGPVIVDPRPFPVSTSTPVTPEPKQNEPLLPSTEGSAIRVKPFSSEETTVPTLPNGFPAENVDLDVESTASGENLYIISYVAGDQSFNIGLTAKPLPVARKLAEDKLRSMLGITNEEMCRLRYSVFAPYWVDERYSGVDLRFSFCKDAVSIN